MDLQFIKNPKLYETIDIQISKSALKKICGNLWYLTPETAALAFFNDNVSPQTKLKMVRAIKSRDIELDKNKRITLQFNEVYEYADKSIDDFISIQSRKFIYIYIILLYNISNVTVQYVIIASIAVSDLFIIMISYTHTIHVHIVIFYYYRYFVFLSTHLPSHTWC